MRKWIAPLLVAVLVLSVAAPAMAKPAKKPVFVSHPYTAKYKNKVATDFKAWGYIRPRVTSAESTVTIVVAKWEGKRSWVTSSGLEATAKTYPAKKFKHATKYMATMNVPVTGRYRMRAVYEWVDSKGAVQTKRSSWKYVKIVN
jgi:hypothetical protein